MWWRSVVLLLGLLSHGCKSGGATPLAATEGAAPPAVAAPVTGGAAGGRAAAPPSDAAASALQARLEELAARAGGEVGIALQHVESGRSLDVGGERWLPLQSVYKLPLAVAVARAVQAGRVRWEQALTVGAGDVVPGSVLNQRLWQALPRTLTVRELLEYSLVYSDNVSSTKLVALIGGRGALVEQMRALGFAERAEPATAAGAPAPEGLPYYGQAAPVARLLAGLQRGEVLPEAERAVLWQLMSRARTGERRIRAGAPPGATVLEKTGTGRGGSVTNDVGLITLPGGAGHLALAVLVAGSPARPSEQEDLIAEITRAACQVFTSR
jgi:beta-lactamase class A